MNQIARNSLFSGIFSFLISSGSAFAGNVEYHLNKSANPTDDEREAYALIETVMDSAVFLYNKYSDLSKHIEVYYSTGVPTAEASSNGDLRFGKDRNYMFVGTAMHEMAHTMGMGTTSEYKAMFKDGVFQGEKAQATLKEIDGAGAVLKGDSQHFWPYGLNYKSEVHSEQDLINHVRIVNAMYQDIFKEAFYMQGRIVSLLDEKTCMGITSSNALELMSCTDTATFVKIYSVGDNPVTYRIQLGNRVVDIPNESTAEGVVASTYGYNGGAHQRYVFEKAGAPRANMPNVYFLKNFKSGLYLQAVEKNVVQNKLVLSVSSEPQLDFTWQIVEAGQDTSSKDGPVSISRRRAPSKELKESVPTRLFDALGRAAGKIRRGVTSRILKSN